MKECGLIGADNGETSGDVFHVRRIEGAVKAVGEKHASFGWVIGQEQSEAEVRMRFFDFENGPRRHMVKRAVMADEEFIHSVFGDMPLDRFQQGGIDGGRRVAVTDEEAGGHG